MARNTCKICGRQSNNQTCKTCTRRIKNLPTGSGECKQCGINTHITKSNLCYKCRTTCPNCLGLKHHLSNYCQNCSNIRGRPRKYSDGKIIAPNGYVQIYAKDHPGSTKQRGYILEHRLVMEKHLERYLLDNENIHHKNGIRDDNRIENLELWVSSQPSGQRVSDLIAWANEIIQRYGNNPDYYNT